MARTKLPTKFLNPYYIIAIEFYELHVALAGLERKRRLRAEIAIRQKEIRSIDRDLSLTGHSTSTIKDLKKQLLDLVQEGEVQGRPWCFPSEELKEYAHFRETRRIEQQVARNEHKRGPKVTAWDKEVLRLRREHPGWSNGRIATELAENKEFIRNIKDPASIIEQLTIRVGKTLLKYNSLARVAKAQLRGRFSRSEIMRLNRKVLSLMKNPSVRGDGNSRLEEPT